VRLRTALFGNVHTTAPGPAFATKGTIMRILIGVDDSEESQHAVEVAHRFFGDADYKIVSVGERTPLLVAGYPSGSFATAHEMQAQFDAAQRAAQEATSQAVAVLPPNVTHVVEEVDMGRIGETLCRVAEEDACDVIVIGSQDKNVWQRLFDPSVGRYLIDNAHCPVLVVR